MTFPSPSNRRISRDAYCNHLQVIRATDRELAAILRDAASAGERIVTQTLSDPQNISQAVRRGQYASSVQALRDAQGQLWGHVTRATRSGMLRASIMAEEGLVDVLAVLQRSVDDVTLGGLSQARILLESMEAASRLAVEDVRSRLLNNIPLSDRVVKTEALANRWIDRTVNRGIALQKSAGEIARDVRGLIRPDTPGGVSFAAKRIARTEINNAFHATEVRGAARLPWVEAFQWNLSGSHPREDECDDYAEDDPSRLGRGIWPKEDVPMKPHPQCLCYLTTVSVSPSDFNSSLLSGQYDGWLASQGFPGFRAAS